jgi:tetratricopeptide (TPR) repeat protein
VKTVLDRGERSPRDKPYYYYLLGLSYAAQGRIQESVEQLRLSYEADKAYLHPLFALADIYVQLGQIDNAEVLLAELRRANARVRYPRNQDLARLERNIATLQTTRRQPDVPAGR